MPDYLAPPPINYMDTRMRVGILVDAFEHNTGPQRDRWQDKPDYKQALKKRAAAYGDYNPAILSPRIVSDRGNGEYWPLDGNGSNHWLRDLFGPDFEVAVRLIPGLSPKTENALFQDLQKSKRVTANEKFQNDKEYNPDSEAAKINAAVEAVPGFHISPSPKDAWGVAYTTAKVLYDRHTESGIVDLLAVINGIYPEDQPRRTNGAVLKGVAWYLCSKYYDRNAVIRAVKTFKTAADLAEGSYGGAGGELRVKEKLEEAMGR